MVRVVKPDVNHRVTHGVAGQRRKLNSRNNGAIDVVPFPDLRNAFKSAQKMSMNSRPPARFYIRPSESGSLDHGFANPFASSAEPFLPENEVRHDLSYRMVCAGEMPLRVLHGYLLERSRGRDVRDGFDQKVAGAHGGEYIIRSLRPFRSRAALSFCGQIFVSLRRRSRLDYDACVGQESLMQDHIPELRIQFTKRADGSVILRCVRRDGSATWERRDKHALFFSFHDLIHLAVETSLGFRQGFYGLLADGWDIADTTGKGARGKAPAEGVLLEHVVGLFDSERAGGGPPLSAIEFNGQLQQMVETDSLIRIRTFTETELIATRNGIEALHKQWAALPPDSTFELSFDRENMGR
jgi:hypothetical protein